jgi:hypothetical protein
VPASHHQQFGDPVDPNPPYAEPPYWLNPQPQYLTPPYLPPAYQPYGQQPWTAAARGASGVRPSGVLTSVVLAYCTVALLCIAALVVLVGASQFDDSTTSFGGPGSARTPLTLLGLADLLTAGLFGAGAVLLLARRSIGRGCLAAGSGACIVLSLIWFGIDSDGASFWATVFIVLAVLTPVWAFMDRVSQWLAGAAGTSPGT